MLPPGFYCERVIDQPWGEPLNALSNFAFLIAAAAVWRAAGAVDAPLLRRDTRLLGGLLALVGLASLSFHTWASTRTGALDVLSIGLFNLAYLWLFVRRVLGGTRSAASLAAVGFVALDQLRMAVLPARLLFGSTLYLPPLVVLLVLIGLARRRAPEAARGMGEASLVFVVSLTARTLDQPLCPVWPFGLHWLWHLLNAWVLWRLVKALQAGAGAPSVDAPR